MLLKKGSLCAANTAALKQSVEHTTRHLPSLPSSEFALGMRVSWGQRSTARRGGNSGYRSSLRKLGEEEEVRQRDRRAGAKTSLPPVRLIFSPALGWASGLGWASALSVQLPLRAPPGHPPWSGSCLLPLSFSPFNTVDGPLLTGLFPLSFFLPFSFHVLISVKCTP